MKQYCICIFLLFLVFKGNSQDDIRCATPAYENSLRIKYPGYAKRLQNLEKKIREKNNSHRISATRQEVITIPVVVHVLYNSSNSNISDAKIHAQIKVLNEDFRRLNKDTTNTPATFKSVAGDTKIQFVLSNRDPQGRYTSGIIRKFVSNKSFIVDVSDDDQTLKSISRWPSDAYLNIWVTTLSNFDKKEF